MINIVVAKALTDQLLEQVGLFVGTFGRTETGNTLAINGPGIGHAIGRNVERLFPAGLTEMRQRVGRVNVQPLGGGIITPDQRPGQPVRVMDIIKAETALDAEPVLVGRAFNTLNILDFIILDLEGQLAANPAIRADRLNLTVIILAVTGLIIIQHGGRHQRACRAGLNAFTAGNAGGMPHRVIHIKDDFGIMATPSHADHIIDLDLTACPDTEIAVNAGIQIDPHRHMAVIQKRHMVSLA